MKTTMTKRTVGRSILAAILFALCCGGSANAQLLTEGEFSVAYAFSSLGHARAAAPSPTELAGVATLQYNLAPHFLIGGSTQTFTSTSVPGSGRTTKYGVTELEATAIVLDSPSGALNRDLSFDYILTLPTGGTTPGVENYAHQFLAMFAFDHSARQSFEIDTGDYMSGRDSRAGYKHTALLSLIAGRNFKSDGMSPSNMLFELDASPSSEGAPASVVATGGVIHDFKSGFRISALAIVGLTAYDPAVGVSISLKYRRNLIEEKEEPHNAMAFARDRRLESRISFGRLGRF